MVTSVSAGSVLEPPSAAVTVNEVFPSSSPTLLGLTVSVTSVTASSSSSIVVVTTDEVPRLGVAPPPPDGPDIVTVNVSPDSSKVSSVVCTVNVLSAWSD